MRSCAAGWLQNGARFGGWLLQLQFNPPQPHAAPLLILHLDGLLEDDARLDASHLLLRSHLGRVRRAARLPDELAWAAACSDGRRPKATSASRSTPVEKSRSRVDCHWRFSSN